MTTKTNELDHLLECLDQATEDQHHIMIAHAFRIPNAVSRMAVIKYLLYLKELPYGSLKMREMDDLKNLTNIQKGTMITYKGINGRIVNHVRSQRRNNLLHGSWFEYTLQGMGNGVRTMTYDQAWSALADGELDIWTT